MNCMPVLPVPLRHKIAGWNLPPAVELALLEQLRDRIVDDVPVPGQSVVRSLEFSACDPPDGLFRFYVQYTVRMHRNVVALLDVSIDCLPPE
jgi:hypothetical protein